MIAQTSRNFRCVFTIKNVDSSAYDLTALAITMAFKRKRGSTAALTASVANGMLSLGTDPTAGLLTLSIPAATMATLEPDNYRFDAVLSTGDALFSGTLQVVPSITNDATKYLPTTEVDESGITVTTPADAGITINLSGSTIFSGIVVSATAPAAASSIIVLWQDTVNNLLIAIWPDGTHTVLTRKS